MHLVVGFIQIMLAYFLASLHRLFGFEWIGREAVRLCCSAFLAGAGLDDAAIDVVRAMGDDGARLLKQESEQRGEQSIAALMVKMLEALNNA